ncbi:NADH-quinone oxidoreductase subunit J family protein [Salinimicrobium xinjiangense]|uniref:NADH-quinone oxidoreductase subunit J family protein n=1 Tax=Salinimicrobium xinjiangense TaxID=438596 RepID=UPI000414D032|nr:NADH-quinone oxidoreductase subunit J [Salinimicrobium xinjiangense]
MEKLIFYILAVIMIASAVAAVSSRKMLRSVVYLLFVLIGAAGLYFQMDYNFLAAIQLTVYAGGVVVLIIFSVLLIQHIEMELEVAKKYRQSISALLCLMGLSLVLATIYAHPFEATGVTTTTTTAEVGRALLSTEKGGFILPFEVISVLLLSAMIGAIVIAKGGNEIEKSPLEKIEAEKLLEEITKEVETEKVPEENIGV